MAETDMGGGVNPLEVRKMIEAHRDKMLIIRRRDFEVDALLLHPRSSKRWWKGGERGCSRGLG